MSKISETFIALLIWACILVLCGEKTEDASLVWFYTSKCIALIVIVISGRWLDTKLSGETKAK